MAQNQRSENLQQVRDTFIAEWATLGQAWGINRTMAQIQALLLTATDPLNTDQIMNELAISRGNAHANLKELLSWGLAKKVLLKGDRKEYFVGEQEPWTIFCKVARERQRREIEPLMQTLQEIESKLIPLGGAEAKELKQRIQALAELTDIGHRVLGRIAAAEKGKILKWLLKMA